MLNHITIHGRIARDPELRATNSGKQVASFTVAVDRSFQSGGEKQTDFIDCVAWGKTGETINNYFVKGSQIIVEGSLQSRKWQDKNGNNRVSWEVNVASFDFCGSKNETSSSEKPQFTERSDDEDGELPF